MNKPLLIALFLAISLGLKAQTKPSDVSDLNKIEIQETLDSTKSKVDNYSLYSNKLITEEPDIEPEFPGGEDAFITYLTTNIKKIPLINHIRGKVIVQFVIQSDGHVIEPKILSGEIPDTIKQQIKKVLVDSPAWSPPIQNHKPVRVMYTMPLLF